MTTNVWKGMSAARRAVDGDTSNLDKQWKKAELVDMVLGLAFFVRSLPQGAGLFKKATKLMTASPNQGGGFDNVRAALGDAFNVTNAPIWTALNEPASTVDLEASLPSPAAQCMEASGVTNTDVSGVNCGGDQNAVGLQTSSGSSPSATPRQKACKTAYDGFKCHDVDCPCWHPTAYCHESSCYPRRQTECTDWHPRKWSRAAQGNGARGGTGRPFSSKPPKKTGNIINNKGTGNNKNNTTKNPLSKVKRLESELTKTRAQLSSQRVVGRTFRDALLASQVAPSPSPPQHKVNATKTKATPVVAGSVPVLPLELTTILSTLARALAAAGIPSQ